MLRHLLLGIGTLAFTQAAAAQPPASRVTFEGVTAEFTRSLDAAGALHLEGRLIETGEHFHFVVPPSGRASGHVGNRAVEFRVRRAVREAALAGARPQHGPPPQALLLAAGDAARP